ncbi:MAG: PspC domain-containing protein [Candidatus Omnitrophica bacterium]|nr:PspC domain-containing protein [Candidatus Omnitrophota bacterium]
MKKLYRVKKGHKIAGVCAGLGEYFLVDPVFFRLIFLIIIFGFGIGLLVYLILWVATPLNNFVELSRQIKRLYLSDKDKKIGGVCGGLGEYSDIDPVIFRILFLIGIFIGGIGLLAYLIMYLIMPKNIYQKPDEKKFIQHIDPHQT